MAECLELFPLTRRIRFRDHTHGIQPVLTVAIPAYKHAGYIDECLAGVLGSNSRSKIEVIVLDDCSPDDTVAKVVKAFNASDIRFLVYRNETNQGLTYGLDFLMKSASAPYFLVCASDDVISGQALDQVVDQIVRGNGPDALEIFAASYFGDRHGTVYERERMAALVENMAVFCEWLQTEIPKPLLLQSTIFNTRFLKELDPWKDRLLLDDWPTFIRAGIKALNEGRKIHYNPDVILTQYRVHSSGQHSNAERQRKACLEVVETVIPPGFRRIARAHVLSELVISDLSRRQFRQALDDYGRAIVSYPRLETLMRTPTLVLSHLFRKLSQRLTVRE